MGVRNIKTIRIDRIERYNGPVRKNQEEVYKIYAEIYDFCPPITFYSILNKVDLENEQKLSEQLLGDAMLAINQFNDYELLRKKYENMKIRYD